MCMGGGDHLLSGGSAAWNPRCASSTRAWPIFLIRVYDVRVCVLTARERRRRLSLRCQADVSRLSLVRFCVYLDRPRSLALPGGLTRRRGRRLTTSDADAIIGHRIRCWPYASRMTISSSLY
ncbi:hypothetical protein EVAR_11859_1 [Eumeta japonica]|uniref:Uncharacterized protein n=1 Tax=Eumeta variegata TaxID=151549 RepID=A0A4C1U8T5_EUMVA|nr:hypothetical protein EVAR_11859_1 [Eumeta japonica]